METMILVSMHELVQAYEAAAAHLMAIGCATTLADDCYTAGQYEMSCEDYVEVDVQITHLNMILSMTKDDVEEFYSSDDDGKADMMANLMKENGE